MGTWNVNQAGTFGGLYEFYPQSYEEDLNGIIFIQLRAGAYKDVVVIKGEELKIYRNEYGEISSTASQTYPLGGPGNDLDAGYFSTGGVHEDLVVAVANTMLKFFKNNFDGTLTELPVPNSFTNLTGVKLGQMDSKYPPYLPVDPSNREDVIISRGIGATQSEIAVYKNNNYNGLAGLFGQVINLNFHLTDFQIADFTEDGFNDIVVSGDIGTARDWTNDIAHMYVNLEGELLYGQPRVVFDYLAGGYQIGNMTKIAVADFNKDGWNDLLFNS